MKERTDSKPAICPIHSSWLFVGKRRIGKRQTKWNSIYKEERSIHAREFARF